jgi:hypothetical protein
MARLVKDFASKLGWRIARGNVLVEGTSDVAIVKHASSLYQRARGVDLLGQDLAVIAVGYGNDGGVDGINRRLPAIRQVAAADPGPGGKIEHRFIGLYDNDPAGQRAIANICSYDSTIERYSDVFVLQPVMSLKGGVPPQKLSERFARENAAFRGLDWEMEDLVSEDLRRAFDHEYPTATRNMKEIGGRIHREMTVDGKRHLIQFVRDYAELKDIEEVIRLIRALRDYCGLQSDHISI